MRLPSKYSELQNLLIIILCSVFFSTYSQSFQPVIYSDSTSWDLAHHELFGIEMGHLYTVKFPDSLYSKLFLYGPMPDTNYLGEIREDTITGRLWFKDVYNNEKLIMDMTLSVGDTFQIDPYLFSTVDSIFYREGRKILQFDLFTNWDEPVYFIEGVGPNISVIYPIEFYDYHYAACKYHSDTLVYVNTNDNFNECEPKPIGINDRPNFLNVIIYPNPASTSLHFEILTGFKAFIEFKIIDSNGRIVMQERISGNENTISLKNLISGIYTISMIFNQKHNSQILVLC